MNTTNKRMEIKLEISKSLIKNIDLIKVLTSRAIQTRYQGTGLGITWSVIQPLIMMIMYTFVFTVIFKSYWHGSESTGTVGYALNLFTGLIVYNIFAESVSSAPRLIIGNANYVTKVIFPLEVLGITVVGSAVVQASISLIVLILVKVVLTGAMSWNIFWVPVIWLPYMLSMLSVVWVVSAIGTYIRDIEQIIPFVVTVMMFMSCVFYPLKALPGTMHAIISLNPVARVIEDTRNVVINDGAQDPVSSILRLVVSLIICELALRVFKKMSEGFSDVL